MITRLIYRCPLCGRYDWLAGDTCRGCGARVDRIGRTDVTINGERRSIAHWYDCVLAFDSTADSDGSLMASGRVRLSEEVALGMYRGLGGMRAVHYGRRPKDAGRLRLTRKRLVFSGEKGDRETALADIVSLTIESNTVIVVPRKKPALFFDFLEESGKKWEDVLRRVLDDIYAPRRVAEYFPRLRFHGAAAGNPANAGHRERRPRRPETPPRDPHFLYDTVRFVLKRLIRAVLPLTFEGTENIPARGAAVLMANHSSFLDSILLEAFLPRHIWFMTKNSQYNAHPILYWFLPLARSFPVRRYSVDAQAVRNAVRVIAGGHVLGIFPEGERSWDGRMLPFKHGTMRLALALGKPVIPVGISGAYGLMPRWTHSISRAPVTVRIGAPIVLPRISGADQTAADIAWVTGRLRNAISTLADSKN